MEKIFETVTRVLPYIYYFVFSLFTFSDSLIFGEDLFYVLPHNIFQQVLILTSTNIPSARDALRSTTPAPT